MKLDIGAGGNRHGDDYTTVDLWNEKADIKAKMWDIPLPDESVDAIWAEACLEHVSRSNVPRTLVEWHRLLKPGAEATIIVPNFDYIATYWLRPDSDRIWAHMLVFGSQVNTGEFHRCGFTPASFLMDLAMARFNVVSFDPMQSTHMQQMMRAVCTKIKFEDLPVYNLDDYDEME